ncbi:GTP-binding protein [Acetobacterium woodii]|uniref:GTP-binding protein n=1 Tax=Acetobacterium woodii TaxID=33952 RepID=UPI00031EF587|nr:GTP-binding protein [Acetobacterium woodii]
MKILILGGFLGSGKTTVLLQLAHYLVEKSQNNKQSRVVIIENEIGQIGIDDKVLRGNGYEVQEIFSGCVCCSLNSDLISGIKDIQKATNPEWVIIEATGVAFPDKIAESLLMNLEIESRIIIIADAQRWKRIRIPLANLIEGQLKDAHLILINKTDLVDEQELTEVEADIYKLNSDAKIARISGIKPVEERILQVIKND